MLTSEQREKILKSYLKHFFVKLTKSDIKQFELIKDIDNYFILTDINNFIKIGCYILTKSGYKNYIYYDFSDLIYKLLGKDDDSLSNVNEDILIVTIQHSSVLNLNDYVKNSFLTCINKRRILDKKTIVLTDSLVARKEFNDTFNFKFINLTNLQTNKEIRSNNIKTTYYNNNPADSVF